MRNLTVVMYHYVRDISNSRYPGVKGLELALFKSQIDYLLARHAIVRMEDVIEAAFSGGQLPENAVLLTFDDGYADHFRSAFPYLRRKRLQGAFYPSVRVLDDPVVLDVNKVHFLLACTRDMDALVRDVFRELDDLRDEFGLKDKDEYYRQLAHPGRFDSASVIFVKRLLQRELPPAARSRIAGNLFERHVGVPEEVFSRDLYMSEDQLRLMLDCGMHIGAHGYGHQWMGSLTEDGQRYEITQSLAFLDRLGMGQNLRTFCYPYGDYSPGLLPLLESYGFRLGFTSVPAVADLDRHEFLTLPRLDTNDLPHRALIPGGTPETVSARAPA